MNWMVTVHPALTGEVTSASPDAVALISDLLRLERDGGFTLARAEFPSSLPSELWVRWRVLILPSGYIALLSGSWVHHECCVLGLMPAHLCDDAAAYAAWGDTVVQRSRRLQQNDVEPLYLLRFLDMFAASDVAAAEAVVMGEYQRAQRLESIGIAMAGVESTLSGLFGLDQRHRQHLMMRLDFILDQLRAHLEVGGGDIYLGVRFQEDSFEFKKFADLPRPASGR